MAASLLSPKWRTNVLWLIWTGKNRFNQILRELPMVNRSTLMRVLRDLEEDGLISRTEYGPRPAPVEYSLTALGLSLGPLMAGLADWGKANAEKNQ